MSDHTKVYDPYIYADGVQEPRTVERYSCRECDCEWPCGKSDDEGEAVE